MNLLEIRFSYPKVIIKNHLPEGRVETRDTELQIRTSGPTMEVDNRAAFEELGIITPARFSQENAASGREAATYCVLKYARLGDRYAREMVSQATVAQEAKEEARDPLPELNVDLVPKSRPQITFHFEQEISWREGEIRIEFQIHPPNIQWQMGEIHINPQKGNYFDRRG